MNKSGKISTFFRKNAAYIVLAFCILAVGLSLTLILLNENGLDDTVNVEPPAIIEPSTDQDVSGSGGLDIDDIIPEQPVIKVISFCMPVSTPTSITGYSQTMVFYKTLKRYSAHLATDFFAEEGTPVKAVYDGTVEKVENNLLTGISITIDHGDGLKTVYNSLESGDIVKEGQTISQGDVIGKVSLTNKQESGYGAHLHFEVIENGESIDPVKYLVIDEK